LRELAKWLAEWNTTHVATESTGIYWAPEVGRISGLVSFEPDLVSVQLDGAQLRLEPGQTVIPHGPDRDLTVAEAFPAEKRP